MQLQSKTALVTGASRGIGRAIALKLASEGADVVVNYAKNESAAREVVAQIEALGRRAVAVGGDVSDFAAIDHIIAQTREAFGGLDILVNNAGTGEFVPFTQATPEHFNGMFDLNVRGLFFTTQKALEIMRDGGRIINISSIAARGLSAEGAAYSATKGAVNSFTAALSKGLGDRGITVNAISPGLIETDLSSQSFTPEEIERMVNGSLFKRVGSVDDIAEIALFLASDASRWITGREIVADGGTL